MLCGGHSLYFLLAVRFNVPICFQTHESSFHQVPSLGSSSFALPGTSVGVANSSPSDNQVPWPKMRPSDVKKYMKVFMEVDIDGDGKITA